jgi:hypothetical protein
LIAYTGRPVPRSAATSRPRGVSMATGIGSLPVSPAAASSSVSSVKPSTVSEIRRFATSWPCSSMTAMSWWGRPEARCQRFGWSVSSGRPPEPDVRVGPASGSPQVSLGVCPQVALGHGEGIFVPLGR